ncbi:bifunctional dihydrofolate reductase-thymidylate synthase-like [Miscanthus floridulus]|uniref:bifunctional dihydrofolate reductase-thymidylate synthase-like n=1 Tax=Miscanthus floridulus TaxID=154761 RepID=UPI00345A0204
MLVAEVLRAGAYISRFSRHACKVARFSSTACSPISQFRKPQFLYLSTKSRPYHFSHSRLMAMAAAPANGDSQSGPQRNYQVVVAATRDMGIGKDGVLPWKLLGDLKFFKELTLTTSDPAKKNAVIMGRKTWESIPVKSRPLPGRLNVILTRSGSFDFATVENVVICGSMKSALELLASTPYCLSIEKVFVVGGGQVLREYLNGPACQAIHLTDIQSSIECDTFIPPVDFSVFQPWYSSFPVVESNIRHSFVTFVRVRKSVAETHESNGKDSTEVDTKNDKFEIENFSFLPKMVYDRHEEYQYLNLVEDIIRSGAQKNDRTGTGTLSKFGCQMRFNLRKNFPLLTTKRVFWRGVVEELLWFISGSTNAKVLQEKGIHIWDGNASREYPDSVGLAHREEGDLGPVYGFQWRHFGAEYTDMHADYTGKGFDQLMDVIDKIKNNPDDRRIILSAWNPSDLKKMALPPCHMFAQFYVENGDLSCQMYQRSADMGLGVPFNIASYSLLTYMIAQVCDLSLGDFVHVIGDAHVYRTHVRALEEQIQKMPKPFPILKINPSKKNIDSFMASDFKLVSYDPHQRLEMKMAV